jgi:O-acetyl-ADP-ribose deacetylase (regulator of RNase III)
MSVSVDRQGVGRWQEEAEMSEQLVLLQGDITEQKVDAIVNAANTELAGGGGVDGAIHRAGGPAISAECERLRAQQGGCPTGSAVITTGGRMGVKAVIHTAGPVWDGGAAGEPEKLELCYRNSLELARRYGLRTVAFPSISTGVYGYPVQEAAKRALNTVKDVLASNPDAYDEVRFVLFSEEDLATYRSAMKRVD